MVIDRPGLAEFLRRRREALQPEDVGLPRGPRRRTSGLRREEVAFLSRMSTDYYKRLERQRGSQPSAQILASMAQALYLTLDERDHLFFLAGHHAPLRGPASDHINPGLLRVFQRLSDTPAEIVDEVGTTLRQNTLGAALTGDTTRHTGWARSIAYRWFTDPETRLRYSPQDHARLTLQFVSQTRALVALRGPGSRATELAGLLLSHSTEFRALWDDDAAGVQPDEVKRFAHPAVGPLELYCQALIDPTQSHSLLVYTAIPGSESYDKLQLLSSIGTMVL